MLISWRLNKIFSSKEQEIAALNNNISSKTNEIAKLKEDSNRKIRDRDIEIQKLK